MTTPDPTNPSHDIWYRLRATCAGHAPDPTWDMEWYQCQWHHVRGLVCYPPATAEQLRTTEARLGIRLPEDLRRLYLEVANGGMHLGPVNVFFGAHGGCPVNPGWRPHTLDDLANDSDWQLHPQIEEALLRNPRRYVIAESAPANFLWIGDGGCSIGLQINVQSGCVYHLDYWGDLPDPSGQSATFTNLICLRAVAPSLSAWFAQWLDGTWQEQFESDGELLPEMVTQSDEVTGLDPYSIWRGLYRFGSDWYPLPDDASASDDSEHAIYMTYVEDAERAASVAAYGNLENSSGELPDEWFVDVPSDEP